MKGHSWRRGVLGLSIATSLIPWTSALAVDTLPSGRDWRVLQIAPPNMNMFDLGYDPSDPRIRTSLDVSEAGLTLPSLWWAQQLYGGRLLEHWVAFPSQEGLPPRVDLVVNEQVWSIYGYLERYTFVNRLGMEAQDYGYVTRVFDRGGDLLSAYVCGYEAIASNEIQLQENCSILLDALGRDGLTGSPRPGASPSTGDGRFQR